MQRQSNTLPALETPRLLLSPLADRHFRRLRLVANDRAIADTTISVPHPLTELEARKWLDKAISESIQGRGAHYAVAIRPNDHHLVGYVAIKAIDHEHKEGELSFWLEQCHEGRGYVTEAAAALLEFAFQRLHLNRICAYHMARNPASSRILTKLGFTQEGRLRQRVRKWGIYEDALVWSKLATDSETVSTRATSSKLA